MVLYPEFQRKAQEEIDRVIGNDRFPTFVDQANLPYLDAVVKEVLRWAPVGPLGGFTILRLPCSRGLIAWGLLGIPHAAAEDDVYEGYFIPKGSTVIANIW